MIEPNVYFIFLLTPYLCDEQKNYLYTIRLQKRNNQVAYSMKKVIIGLRPKYMQTVFVVIASTFQRKHTYPIPIQNTHSFRLTTVRIKSKVQCRLYRFVVISLICCFCVRGDYGKERSKKRKQRLIITNIYNNKRNVEKENFER